MSVCMQLSDHLLTSQTAANALCTRGLWYRVTLWDLWKATYTTHAQVLANTISSSQLYLGKLASLEQPREPPCSNEDMQMTLNTLHV